MSKAQTEAEIGARYAEIVTLARDLAHEDLTAMQRTLRDLSRRLGDLAGDLADEVLGVQNW